MAASAVALVLVGCGDEARSDPRPDDRGPRSAERIRDTALHARHAGAAEPVACEACHEVLAGQYQRSKSWQCANCHESTRLALHAAAPADSGARECWACHDFSATDEQPAPCATCHAQAQGTLPAIAPHDPKAPNEDCGACHRAHREPSLASTRCESCHDDEVVTGHDEPDIQITGCASCHGYHEDPAVAAGRCTNCHRQSRARVSQNATFEGGHEQCVTCHPPHRFLASEVTGCRDECHDGVVALSENKVRKHRGCLGCHDEHDVRKSLPKSCDRCHAIRPEHPVDRSSRSRCIGCHEPHAQSSTRTAVACSKCHRDARSDRGFHQGAGRHGPVCKDCHAPHAFDLKQAGVALCRSCHGAQPFQDAPSIQTHAKHSDCVKCHGDTVAHTPTAERAACATCHAAEASAARNEHENCVGCHDPHTASQNQPCAGCHAAQASSAPADHQECMKCHDQHSTLVKTQCSECHEDRTTGIHAPVDGGCASCHRPHGPNGNASPPACTSCHTQKLPGLHRNTGHAECTKCHQSHGEQAYRRPATCLACHDDKQNHEPTATMCIGCHGFGDPK